MKTKIIQWLLEDRVDLFLGYKMVEGHPLPHFFSKDDLEEIEDLETGPARYPLEKLAAETVAEKPDIKIGILARECNMRALNVLYAWNQLSPDNIEVLNVNCCPSNLEKHGDCSYLEPEKAGEYKKEVGMDPNLHLDEMDAHDSQERFDRWIYEFQKCIKCYGCRNICPVCFCSECSLEHPDLVATGALPPEVPIFHMVRAVHMAGRCIDCGLCEDACPVDIPLRLLYRKSNEIVKDLFDYEAGTGEDQSPFTMLGDKVTLEPKTLEAA
jgi:ferredoxin